MAFTHLHLHSQFSLLDSTVRFDELFEAAVADKMSAVALTDHGNMFGVLDFYMKGKEYGVKPILGCEMYLAPGSRLMKNTGSGDDEQAPYLPLKSGLNHLILLVQNEIGYRNLCKLVSSGYLEGFYYKPRIDKEILAKHSEGLIATSACMKGEIPNLCMIGDMDRAREAVKSYQEIFGERFYLEMQNNGVPQQMMINQRIQELAKDMKVKLVGTADVHYLKKEDVFSHEVLMAIQTGHVMEDTSGANVPTDEYYFKPQATMEEEFAFCPEAIANTMEIASQCNYDFKFNDEQGKKIYYYPKFEPPGGKTQVDFILEQATVGLEFRLKEKFGDKYETLPAEEKKKYTDRLERELKVINNMGFTGYFLIVSDFIIHAKEHGIPVGPGRGSGAGSLVAWCLKITDLDPLEHGLLFERFLNPERISLPDFDVDFCKQKRDQIIHYVVQKYGTDCVAQIITFGKLQARGVIRDVGRVFGMVNSEIDRIAKLVPETLNISLEEAFEQEIRLRQLTETDPKMAQLFQVCRTLEGLGRHASIHAAGLVISNRPMVEHVPLFKGKNDEMVIQFDMGNADRIGLIKFDFLGLKNLTFLENAERLINQTHPGLNFRVDKIPLNDPKMYQQLAKGDTFGVFQLESSGMQDLLKKARPDRFADIIAIISLYRPGPMVMLDEFIGRKHGTIPILYEFEELRPILQETYGIMVYQEQVQQIAMKLASYSAGGADLLRRAMGKKKPEEMAKQKQIFLDGATKNGHNQQKAEVLFDLMAKFAEYGFNKSHAAAYSVITCQTAYVKTHFPNEFYAALLSSERDDTDNITKYIADAKRHKIEVLQPDINESETDFTVLKGDKIRFGLGAIKGVGQVAIDSILEARKKDGPFKDLFDFCTRTNTRTTNKRVLESLTKAGAFDGFGVNRASLFKSIDSALEMGSSVQKTLDDNQPSFADLLGGEDVTFNQRKVEYAKEEKWPRLEELRYEKDTIGFYVTGHPLDDFDEELNRYTTTTIEGCKNISSGKDVLIGAEVSTLREIITKRGDRMAFINLEDKTSQIEVVAFSDAYLENEALFKSGEPLWVKGTLEIKEGTPKLILSKKSNCRVLPLRHAYEAMAREIHVHLKVDSNPPADRMKTLKNFFTIANDKAGSPVFLHLDNKDTSTVLKMKELVPLNRFKITELKKLIPSGDLRVDFR